MAFSGKASTRTGASSHSEVPKRAERKIRTQDAAGPHAVLVGVLDPRLEGGDPVRPVDLRGPGGQPLQRRLPPRRGRTCDSEYVPMCKLDSNGVLGFLCFRGLVPGLAVAVVRAVVVPEQRPPPVGG